MQNLEQVVSELKAMRYSDSQDFRDFCVEYATKEGMTIERATCLLKAICDSRERGA